MLRSAAYFLGLNFLKIMFSIEANTPSPSETVFTVKQLNTVIKNYLEQNFSNTWVTGEISNFSQPSSGHFYFTLKDSDAQIRCAFFRQKQWGLKIKPFDGMQVLVRGKLSLYSERGDYQLIIDQLTLQGEGALQQEFERLKKKFSALGYFDLARKKTIPKNIKTLGIITSNTGAALQDILSVIKRRWPLLSIFVYDTQVQGEEAPKQIIKALQRANQDLTCDCLLLTRGGGSLEDLWAFNNEALCLEILQSQLPIVSAVGHEIDFSLSDFVADLRAATPSAAAELLTPDCREILQKINLQISQCRQILIHQISVYHQRWKNLNQRLTQAMFKQYQSSLSTHQLLKIKLQHLAPHEQIKKSLEKQNLLKQALFKNIETILKNHKNNLAYCLSKLETLGPINTLRRGFSITQDAQTGHVITSVQDIQKDQILWLTMSDGKITCRVVG